MRSRGGGRGNPAAAIGVKLATGANALDTAGHSLFGALMGDHLASGGLIVAATHAPLGIAARVPSAKVGSIEVRPIMVYN